MYIGDVCGIVWSERAGAVFSIHHTHPISMGKTPALCSWLNKKKEKKIKKKLGSCDESASVQGTVWRWEKKLGSCDEAASVQKNGVEGGN